jgi:four helix bundle protein
LGSSYEIETQMEIAHILKYVTDEQYDDAIEKVQSIEKKLTNLINTIRND